MLPLVPLLGLLAAAPTQAPKPAVPAQRPPAQSVHPAARPDTGKRAGPANPATPAAMPAPTMDQIRDAQQRLLALKLYKGTVTGKMSPELTRAIRAYQKQNHLKETGTLTQETLAKLHPPA